jgi:hypothetical protein
MESKFKSMRTQATAVAREVSMLMIACDIDIHQDQIAKRVLQNDLTVCGRKNPKAFEKLRRHLMAFFPLKKAAIEKLDVGQVKAALDDVRGEILRLRDTNISKSPES